MKLLVLGLGQSNFVTDLYREIKQSWPELQIDISNYTKQGEGHEFGENEIFHDFHDYEAPLDFIDFLRLPGILTISAVKRFRDAVPNPSFLLRGTIEFVANELKGLRFRRTVVEKERYDIYHLHYCVPKYIRWLEYLPSDANVVCSIWGSDLLRTAGVHAYRHQLKAFQRADVITVCSLEMKEIFLAKFGRDFAPKVHIVQFPMSRGIVDCIESCREDTAAQTALRKKLGVNGNDLLLVVGHNAFRENNQLDVIRALKALDDDLKSRIVCVFPLTYGLCKAELLAQLPDEARDAGVRCTCIDTFLPGEELALLRLCTDALIYMATSDALSHTVTETLLAGACVITGAWLPYGPYRRAGIQFDELEDFSQLPTTLQQLFTNRDDTRPYFPENPARVREAFRIGAVGKQWKHALMDAVK